MRLKLLLVATALSFLACNNSNHDIPKSVAGMTLEGTRTSGDGVFAGLEGYKFIVKFADTTFAINDAQGLPQTSGQYQYKATSSSAGQLVLNANTGEGAGTQLTVELKFTSSNAGAFDAHASKGGAGQQTGIFKLK